MKFRIHNKKQLPAASKKLLAYAGDRKLLAFYGQLGAGKTTVIKAICSLLGARDIVSSPTFTLVNEYLTKEGETLYHIDFYRIKTISEVLDFGIEEYFSSGSYCFMEWPEMIGDLLPQESVKIRITVESDNSRTFEVT